MCGRGINQHQSSILFGKLLIDYGYREIAVMRLNNTLENLNQLCQGISHFFQVNIHLVLHLALDLKSQALKLNLMA